MGGLDLALFPILLLLLVLILTAARALVYLGGLLLAGAGFSAGHTLK